MRIKKSTVFLTMFVLLLAFTGCQNESSSTDENKQTKSTASDKVIYNQKDLQNPQKLEISEDGMHFALFGGRKCVLERSLCGA